MKKYKKKSKQTEFEKKVTFFHVILAILFDCSLNYLGTKQRGDILTF